jgi:hypothetical protein
VRAEGSPQELYAQVQALTVVVEELAQRLDQATGAAGASAGGLPRLCFADVESWVRGLFLPMFGWRIDGHRWHWCPQWWRHAEAIWRLELLWRSWEVARLHPAGMSSWSAECDRHRVELLGDEGPFRQCRAADGDRPARHVEVEPAAAEAAPPGWWDTVDTAPPFSDRGHLESGVPPQ